MFLQLLNRFFSSVSVSGIAIVYQIQLLFPPISYIKVVLFGESNLHGPLLICVSTLQIFSSCIKFLKVKSCWENGQSWASAPSGHISCN